MHWLIDASISQLVSFYHAVVMLPAQFTQVKEVTNISDTETCLVYSKSPERNEIKTIHCVPLSATIATSYPQASKATKQLRSTLLLVHHYDTDSISSCCCPETISTCMTKEKYILTVKISRNNDAPYHMSSPSSQICRVTLRSSACMKIEFV